MDELARREDVVITILKAQEEALSQGVLVTNKKADLKLYRNMSATLPSAHQLPLQGLGGDDQFVDDISAQSSERQNRGKNLAREDSLVIAVNDLQRKETF